MVPRARKIASIISFCLFSLSLGAALCLGFLPLHGAQAQKLLVSPAGQPPLEATQGSASSRLSRSTGIYVEKLVSMGGWPTAYAADGDTVFVGQGLGVTAIDVSNPNDPIEIDHLGFLDGAVSDIAVHDQTLYAALGAGGLAIIDITSPTAMSVLARYPVSLASAVAVEDGRAYVADSEHGLIVLDVRLPAEPVLLGKLDLDEAMLAVSIANQHAFVSLGANGVLVISVADPASPQLVATHSDSPAWSPLEFSGNFGFVVADEGYGMIYDFTDPAAPKQVGQFPPGAFAIRNHYLYVAGWFGIDVYDVSSPVEPAMTTHVSGAANNWEAVVAGPGTLSLFDHYGMTVYQLLDPASPVKAGAVEMYIGSVESMALGASGLFAVEDDTLSYYALASPSARYDAGGLDDPGAPAPKLTLHLSYRSGVLAACDRRVFISGNVDPGFEAVQVDGGKLTSSGYFAVNNTIVDLACSGEHFFALTVDRLLVFDMSNPVKPRQIGAYEVPSWAHAMALALPRIYILDYSDRVHIIDVSRPSVPKLLGMYGDGDLSLRFGGIAAGDDHIYLPTGTRVAVVDASNAANPVLQGVISPDLGEFSAIFYENGHLLVCSDGSYPTGSALYFFDVTEPTAPVAAGVLTHPIYNPKCAAHAGYIALRGYGFLTYWWSPAVTESFAAEGVVEFSPTSTIAYSVDATQLHPVGAVAASGTVSLTQISPYLPRNAQGGPLVEVISPFTLQAVDAESGAELGSSAPVNIAISLSLDQLEAVDTKSVALYTWNGSAWDRLASSTFDAERGTLTATAASWSVWSVRALPLASVQTTYLPQMANKVATGVSLSDFEVTQSTQTLGNGVPLVAGKAALLRVYATANGPAAARDVYLTLSAVRDGAALPGSPIQVGPWAVFPTWNRGEYGSSFNVPLPLDWTHGDVAITAELQQVGDATNSNPDNHRATIPAHFVNVPALDLMIVPVNYVDTDSGEIFPPPDQEEISDWIARIYPIPGIRVSFHTPVAFQGDLGVSADFRLLLQMVGDIRRSENPPEGRVYYGLLPSAGGMAWAGLGYLSLRASVGINSGETAGHEIGHNFGRLHAPCGGPSNIDPFFPYAGASIGEYGFDSGSYSIWDPGVGRDFMSYCFPKWTSDYTYVSLLTDQYKRGTAVASLTHDPVLWVRAVVREDGAAELLPPYVLEGAPDATPADTACSVQLWDAEGNSLGDHPVAAVEVADGEPARSVSAWLPLPAQPVQTVTLVCDGHEVARTTISSAIVAASAPEVRLDSDSLTIEWTGSNAPSLVQMRRSGDPNWTTLGVDVTGGVLPVDAAALPGGPVEFRVLPAGGVALSSSDSGPGAVTAAQAAVVELPDKEPRVWITGPSAAATGQSVVLFGHGFDPEDGVLEGLTWSVDGTPAGSGDRLQFAAPASGGVDVTLTAVDSAGHTVVAVHRVEGAVD